MELKPWGPNYIGDLHGYRVTVTRSPIAHMWKATTEGGVLAECSSLEVLKHRLSEMTLEELTTRINRAT